MLPALPQTVDFCAVTFARYDPCLHQAIAGTLNGYASDMPMTYEPSEEFEGGEQESKANGCYVPQFKRTTPQRFKWATGELEVVRGNGEFDAAVNGQGLYVPAAGLYSGKTLGYAGTPDLVPNDFWTVIMYSGNDYGDDGCGATPTTRVATLVDADATVVLTTGTTTGLQVGQPVSGTGIPVGATILTITDSTHFELSTDVGVVAGTGITISLGIVVNLAEALIMPKVRIRPMKGGPKTGPHDMKYSLTAFSDLPKIGWTGAFSEIPSAYFTQIRTPSWYYVLEQPAIPAVDAGVMIATVAG